MNYYCGPSYFPKWITKLISRTFNPACRIHDLNYKVCKYTRKEVDLIFLDDMLEISKTKQERFWAYTFYRMVRIFGYLSWKKNR